MPTYEYVCPSCIEQFSAWRTISDRRTAPCPGCGREADKIMSIPQNRVHTLTLMERLPKGADEKQVWENKAHIEKRMMSEGVEVNTSNCLPELRPDPKVKTIH